MIDIKSAIVSSAVLVAVGCSAPAPEDFSDEADYCQREMYDYGADGTFEAVTIYGYDAHERLQWTRGDMENYGPRDGRTNWIRRYFYGDQDRLERIEGDHVHTGEEPDEVQLWHYDNSGRIIRYEQDGTLFTADGRLNHDFPADGEVDLVKSWDYNDQGRKSRLTSDGLGVSDSQPDDEPDEITTWEYNGALVVRAEIRRDGPTSEPDEVITYEYDEGLKSRQEHDYKPIDGQPEVFLVWSYDEEDLPVRQERYLVEGEQSSDDSPVEVIRWAYDSTNRKTRETRDGDLQASQSADGHPDVIIEWRDGCSFDN